MIWSDMISRIVSIIIDQIFRHPAKLERSNAVSPDSIYCPTMHLFILFCKEEMGERVLSPQTMKVQLSETSLKSPR